MEQYENKHMPNETLGNLLGASGTKKTTALLLLFIIPSIPSFLSIFISSDVEIGGVLGFYFFLVLMGFFLFFVINKYYRIEFYENGMKISSLFKFETLKYSEVLFSLEKKATAGSNIAYVTTHLVIYQGNYNKKIANCSLYKNKRLTEIISYLVKKYSITLNDNTKSK